MDSTKRMTSISLSPKTSNYKPIILFKIPSNLHKIIRINSLINRNNKSNLIHHYLWNNIPKRLIKEPLVYAAQLAYATNRKGLSQYLAESPMKAMLPSPLISSTLTIT